MSNRGRKMRGRGRKNRKTQLEKDNKENKETMKTSNCNIMIDKKGKENGGISLKKGEGAGKTRTITKIR